MVVQICTPALPGLETLLQLQVKTDLPKPTLPPKF